MRNQILSGYLIQEFVLFQKIKIYDSCEKAIPTRHVRESAGHMNWVKSHCEKLGLYPNVDCINVFITNSNKIEESALPQADGILFKS